MTRIAIIYHEFIHHIFSFLDIKSQKIDNGMDSYGAMMPISVFLFLKNAVRNDERSEEFSAYSIFISNIWNIILWDFNG